MRLQKTVQVTYEEGMTVGSEIAGFRFDVSDPLAPFTVTGFSKKGPAQIAGVMVGWFLDVGALLREVAQNMEDLVFSRVSDNPSIDTRYPLYFVPRFLAQVTLTFMNGCSLSESAYLVMEAAGEVQGLQHRPPEASDSEETKEV
ncbi:hypothetical protein AK812_SmicGene10353 [Symbiodinium microadriaticum]|uniref:Uncharacterized protein n=1 Tax=Symbiodinium microadriaticum TaxID=2951 RepID=A0A1Q9EFW6_SYMMI|nr:hypothetical protein AK812_SmicGene10353 [Symbiodinium microadriaticum]